MSSRSASLGFMASWLLVSSLAVAAPEVPAAPSDKDNIRERASSVTGYYRYALHLTKAQRRAVQRSTYQHLMQLDSLRQVSVAYAAGAGYASPAPTQRAAAQVQDQYDLAMLRILTPGQYSTFRWLGEQQPATAR
ncbi:hypothetical protein [Hymenobacter guriensis]|uniref:DUF1318 domain-containing protein n=1 Tax=Hymenobacter guriensis TaxID=2793065 RepID=A0ABS0L2L4_9BACT|nr:hypothetical protein [Hymenobacter guriensis]MBG8554345.1 hypothetical protein [Hymenobacter guriensis]